MQNINSEDTDNLFTVETIKFADGEYNTSTGEFTSNTPPPIDGSSSVLDTPINRFQNKDIPGTYLFAGESERQSILEDFPNFIEEGPAFNVGV